MFCLLTNHWTLILNHALAHAWFLEIAFVRDVGICVCLPQGYKLYSRDIEPVQQVNKFTFRNIMKEFYVFYVQYEGTPAQCPCMLL